MSQAESVRALGAARILIGGLTWIAPNLTARLFFIDPKRNPDLPFVGRLFGIRDVALGLGLLATAGESRRSWLKAGVLCDSADAAAAALGGKGGTLAKPAAVLSVGVALSAVGMGVAALAADEA